MKYQAYAEYKDSGVEWLGKVPSHWDVLAIKRFVIIFNGSTPKSGEQSYWDGDISWVTPADLGKSSTPFISGGARNITESGYESCGTSLVPAGTIVLSSRAPIGTLGIAAKTICTNQGCKSLVLDNDSYAKYLYYVLSVSTKQLNTLGRGTTFLELSTDELSSYKLGLASINECLGIANFLDHETAKIDTLIDQQKQLIKLLKEKRQAVISHAVTKGLDPQAPMKDSGVEWLGEVPEHWMKRVKLSNIAESNRGSFVNGPFGSDLLANELKSEGVPVVYIRDIKRTGYKRKSKVCVTQTKADQLDVCKVLSGDVIISKVGDPPGDACVYPEGEPDAIITQDVIRIRVDQSLFSSEFVAMLLNSDFGQMMVNDISVEGTRKRVSLGDFKATKFVFPELLEQAEIVHYVKRRCIQMDGLIENAYNLVGLMQERRTALISAAVTGKIDVRNWQTSEK